MDLKQFFGGLKRSWGFILFIVVFVTGIVSLATYFQPKTYKATARIVLRTPTDTVGTQDVQTVIRRLATIQTLITTPDTLQRAAATLRGETEKSLQSHVHATVEQNSNIVNVSATADKAGKAAAIANAVTKAFLGEDRSAELAQVSSERASLERELVREQAAVGPTPSVLDQAQLQSIRNQITQLDILAASAGTDLQVAQAARPPGSPDTAGTLRNGILAFLAALFFGALVAYARDRLAPRVSGARELSRLTATPVLMTLPPRRSLRRGTAETVEEELFQSLQALVRLQLPDREQHRILMTSAARDGSQARVTAGFARALATNGNSTLVISANFREKRLDREFGLAKTAGFAELLQAIRADGPKAVRNVEELEQQPVGTNGAVPQTLRVLPAGAEPTHPTELLSGTALGMLFDELGRMPFQYVIVDGPPLIAVAETRVLANHAESVLVVATPDSQSPDEATDMRLLLDRLSAPVLGLVAVGATDEGALDYLSYAGSER